MALSKVRIEDLKIQRVDNTVVFVLGDYKTPVFNIDSNDDLHIVVIVHLADIFPIAAHTIVGNDTAGALAPKELTVAETKALLVLNNVDNTSDLNKPVSTAAQTALDLKVDENAAISGATKTKIAYDAKGLVTSGADATTADIADSSNKRYCTDAEKVVIGNTSNGTVNPTNLLSNAYFERWSAGASAAPDGYTLGGAGAAVAREAGIVKVGTYSCKITSAAAQAYLYQTVHLSKGINYWKGRSISFGRWVYATVADKVRINLWDGLNDNYSSYHTGDSTWQWLTCTIPVVNTSATYIYSYVYVEAGTNIGYVDGAIITDGSNSFAVSPKPDDLTGLIGTFVANGATPVTVANANVAITDAIIISLNTVGGTVGAQPHLATITAGAGFTVVATASDTSTYNYCLIKNA